MLQRNPLPYPVDFPTLRVRLEPGDTIDHPERLAELEPVEVDKQKDKAAGRKPAAGEGAVQ